MIFVKIFSLVFIFAFLYSIALLLNGKNDNDGKCSACGRCKS